MTFEARLAVLCLAAFAVAGMAAATLVPGLAARVGHAGPRRRASMLFLVRLLPVAASIALAALVAGSLFAFEPRRHERMGVLIPGLAIFGALLVGTAIARAVAVALATRRLLRRWMAGARPIALDGITAPAFVVEAEFPVVSVIGLLRPRVIVARRVLDACPKDELDAILAHEQGHLDRRDNLRHALLAVAPDVLSWLPVSARVHHAWRDATEDAADDAADRLGAGGRLRLAQALVTVARLAPAGHDVRDLPATALYRGGGVERRVRRLLGPAPTVARVSVAARVASGLAAAGLAAAALSTVQVLIEAAVHGLP